ncbi:DUF3060 domain-containing protein [Actinorugispora endophytica]|uniref:DUF3060 family protein n=1 Tax=Actinorugispora endophytica TaxID=1605990 RepID=A0A4R6UN50_9ACTN|nr:DUF3060 domain-containing protein [Actinorugispora endophytica]TDQ48548.1 DUF3060 family protein [Actinorugispora endophytica]
MRSRILAVAGTTVLVTAMAAGCGGGIDLRDENGAGISIGEDGDVSVGDGDTEIGISGEEGSPGAADGGAVVTDELVNVASDGGTVTEDCGGRDANVAADNATVTLNGACGLVTVLGNGNQVSVGEAAQVNVMGSDNTVRYASGEPNVTNLGSNNTVESGGDAAN